MNRWNEKGAEDTVIALSSPESHCQNDGGRQHFNFFETSGKMLNGNVKFCIENVLKMLKCFEL